MVDLKSIFKIDRKIILRVRVKRVFYGTSRDFDAL